MKRIVFLLCLCVWALMGCNSNTHTESPSGSIFSKPWYKRYTGMVAGKPVVVNLYFYSVKQISDGLVAFGGSYYYRNTGESVGLIEAEIKGDLVRMTEFIETERHDDNGKAKAPEWLVHVSDTGIVGTWKSADGKQKGDISLKENYDNGSYAFDIVAIEDSMIVTRTDGPCGMRIEHNMLTPAATVNKDDAAFLTSALLHELHADSLGATDMAGYIRASNKKGFAYYRKMLESTAGDSAEVEGMYDWEETVNATCDYNDKGLVVYNLSWYNYSGGAHGDYRGLYVCADVAGRKVLHLPDVVVVDTPRLRAMLEQAARKSFRIKPADALSTRLLVDTIPMPANFSISDRGITFHYNPYEVAAFIEGDVSFYFSYAQLGNLLTPYMKQRMGVQ
jgi:hypothetical protein